MLKHLPEGLVPFEDCGFARIPMQPLEGDEITICCRADEGKPTLSYRVNGGHELAMQPTWSDQRFYRFSLGSYPFGTEIGYQLWVGNERSEAFSFDVQRMRRVESLLGLMRDNNGIHACFDGFILSFEAADDRLVVTAHTGQAQGEQCEEAELTLSGGYSMKVAKSGSLCELKRLSYRCAAWQSFAVRERANGEITQLGMDVAFDAKYLWGTGERFDAVNQRGRAANGRVVEKFTRQREQTYLPIPFFMTELGFGWYRESDIPARMDFSNGASIIQETRGSTLSRDVLFFGAPGELVRQFVAYTGKPTLPPEWAFGLWISANGWNCDAEVDAQLQAIKRCDYPADVMVLEAWSDEMTFYRWNDDGSWRNPADTVRRIRDSGLHLVLWQIPIIKHEWDKAPSPQLEADTREAIEKGYCILREDGQPYRITENWFHHSLLPDFTNPDAVKWWFDKRAYLLEMGVEGFKTDGGEFLFDPRARLKDGTRGLEAHNRFPVQYVGAYHRFMQEHGVDGVTFSRADYVGAQTRPMHWAGDQLSEWGELKAQLHAGLTAGLSGVLFWGFDIGGFAGDLPTKELYLRATAMGCFCPVMQWHAEPRSGQFYATHEDGFNNDRSPWNLAEKLSDPEVLSVATEFARIRRRLKPYLVDEAAYCAEHGRPLMAHLCIDYPNDPMALSCEDAYMLGRWLLVAPVVIQGKTSRAVYLPAGEWKNVFTGERHTGEQTVTESCPLTQIPVFERMSVD